MQVYKKGISKKLSKHFNTSEFDCHCKFPECVETIIDPALIDALEELRSLIGVIIIDSGFRCHSYNTEIGGVENSQHLFGKAADCRSKLGLNGNLIARSAEQVAAFKSGGIGIYPTFAHCDVRSSGPARWSYPRTC